MLRTIGVYILGDSDVFLIFERDVEALRHARHVPDTGGDMKMKKVTKSREDKRGLSLVDPKGQRKYWRKLKSAIR
jgi:hypothetical protein